MMARLLSPGQIATPIQQQLFDAELELSRARLDELAYTRKLIHKVWKG